MIEKVNPEHPDKVADRIAGAIVDLAYKKSKRPKIAVEVLIGHETGLIIIESSEVFRQEEIDTILNRISPTLTGHIKIKQVRQDEHLAENQADDSIKCGDNGIFKGVPLNEEEHTISKMAREIYRAHPTDGKYIYDAESGDATICQSNCDDTDAMQYMLEYNYGITRATINPLGYWTGGIDVDSGATNRKLGSDMGRAVTGGGLHGKDLSKADVSVNIYCHLKAQEENQPVEARCAIGDKFVHVRYGDGGELASYSSIVETAKEYIDELGGFEKLAEWGLF